MRNSREFFPTLTKVKGECKFNLQKTSFTTESDLECTVRTNIEITDGSVWEWYISGSLKNIKLGVVEITKNNNFFETFVDIFATTSRTVTFTWKNGQLKTWVNGRIPLKDHIKELKVNPDR